MVKTYWRQLKITLRPLLPERIITFSHVLRGVAAAIWYRFPASGMTVIAVTGTNGKTTTVNMIADILEAANHKVAMLSTVRFRVNGKSWFNETKMTTISPFALQAFIAKAREAKAEFLVLETTSHAIAQSRIWGIPIDMAVLTNVTHDHLDYHKSFDAYRRAKMKIFEKARFCVINKDDKSAAQFERAAQGTILTYGINNSRANIIARKLFPETGGIMFTFIAPVGQIVIELPLPGTFNVSNALAAAAAVIPYGVSLPVIKRTLEKFKAVAGRMEKIEAGQPFTVVIDYAHTPDAFEKIYGAIVGTVNGRIIHVFGATGDRDKSKRPILGALAGRYADIVVVTNEDPYNEDPKAIIEQVADGVTRGATKENPKILGENFFTMTDRKAAVRWALSHAKRNDLVLLTGKGHERVMVVGNEKKPYYEREIVIEELKKLGYGK